MPALLAICGAFATAAAGDRSRPVLVLAAVGDRRGRRCRHPGVPAHHRALCRLAAARRRHARDDAERHRRSGGLPNHHRGGQSGGTRSGAAVHRPLRPLCGRVQSVPRLRGDVRRRRGARAVSRPDTNRQPPFAARIGRTFRVRIRPGAAALGQGNGAHDRLDSAAFGGGRCGASAGRAAFPVRGQRRRAPGRAWPSGIPRRVLPRRDLCLPDRALPRRQVTLASAAGGELPDPGADRGAGAACLRDRGDRPDARLRAVGCISAPVSHPADAAGRLPAAAAGGSRAGTIHGAAVQSAERRGHQSEWPRTALAALRAGGRRVAMARLGRGRWQYDHPAGQRAGGPDRQPGCP